MTNRICAFKDCANPAYCRGFCTKHYTRWRMHGDPSIVKPSHGPVDPWSHIPQGDPDECWEWTGTVNKDGYGQFRLNEKTWIAPRWVLTQKVGPLKPGEVTRHDCDNPLCCNPSHLRRGAPRDNTRDMVNRNRHISGDRHWTKRDATQVQGVNNGEAKLTESQVVAIRDSYAAGGVTQTILAEQYGVTQNLISKIVRRRIWRHI